MKLKQPDIKGFNPLDTINEKSKPTPMMQQYLEVKSRHTEYFCFIGWATFMNCFSRTPLNCFFSIRNCSHKEGAN